jgi:hypothetical protein
MPSSAATQCNVPHPQVADCACALRVDLVGCIGQVGSLQQLRKQLPVKQRAALQQTPMKYTRNTGVRDGQTVARPAETCTKC